MLPASEVAVRQQAALEEIIGVLGRHDPETLERIEKDFARGAKKWTPRSGVVTATDGYLLMMVEATASLARLVDQQIVQSKPRPRGRPRKREAS